MKEDAPKPLKNDPAKGLAWKLPKSAQQKRREYLLKHQERLRYAQRAANGEQYV